MNSHTIAAGLGLVLLSTTGSAGLSRFNIAFPGGFGQVAAYSATNGSPNPGGDLQVMSGVLQDFEEAAFGPAGSATVSASYASPTINNSMTGTFAFGYFTMNGHNASPDAASFPGAMCNGGWKETFTVSHPTLGGTGGYLVFKVRGKGNIHTTGLTGSGVLFANPYKNDVIVQVNTYFDRGDSDVTGSANQYARWGSASFGGTVDRSFNGTTTWSVPFTFGTFFTLGVYGVVSNGQRSSGGFGGDGSVTMSAQFNWDGLVGVFNDAGSVSGSTIVAGSGKNWGGTVAPCPGDFNGDGQVDDSDFVIFVVGYNILDCADPTMPAGCPGDINGDHVVDDADFVLFVAAYDALVCP